MFLKPRSAFRRFAVAVAVVSMGGVTKGQEIVPEPPLAEWLVENSAEAQFLDEVQRRAFLFFVEHTDPTTGLTRDRAPADGGESQFPASIATAGFTLTVWCIGDARGWLPAGEARERTLKTLKFVAEHVAHEHGWFYHFIDIHSGQRAWQSEASTIDTALFLKGALAAREHFNDPEIRGLVDAIYARIDWKWAMNGGATLTHGWKPETGFIPWRWDAYAELLGMYLLGIGAPENALPPESWHAWRREPVVTYAGRTYLDAGPLFTHQFAHAWFDFRGQRDAHTDYWQNSIDATLAQREWFADHATKFPHWSKNLWGLTASDSARGYIAWGAPGGDGGLLADGTVVPCAPGGSLPFAPRECVTALMTMREVGGEEVFKRYGFVDAFNPHTGWVATDVIGIDLGIMLLMAENLRTEMVWKMFMKSPEVRLGMWLAGFRSAAPRTLFNKANIAGLR